MGPSVFCFVLTEKLFDKANKIQLKIPLFTCNVLKYHFSMSHVYYRLDFKFIYVQMSDYGYLTPYGRQRGEWLDIFQHRLVLVSFCFGWLEFVLFFFGVVLFYFSDLYNK